MKLAAGDSFPVVTGEGYDEQMKLWNGLEAHKVYKDKPGFQEFLRFGKKERTLL